jgi:hypothetical protein
MFVEGQPINEHIADGWIRITIKVAYNDICNNKLN